MPTRLVRLRLATLNPNPNPNPNQVHCYAYSPPAVLSLERARAVAGHVTSVVVADDMVPPFPLTTDPN